MMSFDKLSSGKISVSNLAPSYSNALLQRLALTLFLLTGPQSSLFAANHYIRAGAGGASNGSSWTDAWPTFTAAISAGFVRGDTYYVAGGTYAEDPYINVNLSGSLWVYFKKANAADNSGDPGYISTYSTTVATIRSLDLDKGYISFDGVTGSGTSGHGFKIYNTSNAPGAKVVQLENGAGPFSISHCEIQGSGFAATTEATTGIYYATFTPQKNLYVGYSWIHEVTTNGVIFIGLVGTSYSDYGLLFENNVISETGGCLDPTKHGQGMQLGQATELGYGIIRNNTYRNIVGSAMIAFLSSGSGANHHDIQIYNNIFFISDLLTYNVLSPGAIWAESDRGAYSNVHIDNLLVANNTFYGLGSASASSVTGTITLEAPTNNNSLVNNVWENCRMVGPHLGFARQSNNGYFGNNLNVPIGTPKQINGSASTFVNAAGGNFQLVSGGYAVGHGRNFPTLFTTDASGLPRGGRWDMSADQFQTTTDTAPSSGEVAATVFP